MTRILIPALILALGAGCIFVDDSPPDVIVVPSDPVVVNAAPYVLDAWAGCYYDDYNRDDVWYFEAYVDDPDGVYDVVQVWADVRDDYTGEVVQSFELYPTDDPYVWFSDWLSSTTWMDCWYGLYSVDIYAYDSFDDFDGVTILPATY